MRICFWQNGPNLVEGSIFFPLPFLFFVAMCHTRYTDTTGCLGPIFEISKLNNFFISRFRILVPLREKFPYGGTFWFLHRKFFWKNSIKSPAAGFEPGTSGLPKLTSKKLTNFDSGWITFSYFHILDIISIEEVIADVLRPKWALYNQYVAHNFENSEIFWRSFSEAW